MQRLTPEHQVINPSPKVQIVFGTSSCRTTSSSAFTCASVPHDPQFLHTQISHVHRIGSYQNRWGSRRSASHPAPASPLLVEEAAGHRPKPARSTAVAAARQASVLSTVSVLLVFLLREILCQRTNYCAADCSQDTMAHLVAGGAAGGTAAKGA